MKVMFIDEGFLICEKEMNYVPGIGDRIWIGKNFFIVDDRVFTLDPEPFVKIFITKISE